MSKPDINHMIAYLQRIGIQLNTTDPQSVEAEYFRKIYKVQPRELALEKVGAPPGEITRDRPRSH